jgi:hypothetical protein
VYQQEETMEYIAGNISKNKLIISKCCLYYQHIFPLTFAFLLVY